jgi:AraC-like DNA-binding protein
MSIPIRLFHGDFGRVALLEMDAPLISHAHHHCHLLLKASGPDTAFRVRGQSYPLTNDNAVLVNAWEEHSYLHELQGDGQTVILALYLEPAWLATFSKSFINSHHPQFFLESTIKLSEEQKLSIEKVVMELWWSDDITTERLHNLLLNLILSFVDPRVVINASIVRPPSSNLAYMDSRIRRAMQMMRLSEDAPKDLNSIATAVNLSRSHFFELFKRCTGLSPLLYANVLKMEFAFSALAADEVGLIEISDVLGFSTQSHFTRFFRQHQGVVPSLYRRQVEKSTHSI